MVYDWQWHRYYCLLLFLTNNSDNDVAFINKVFFQNSCMYVFRVGLGEYCVAVCVCVVMYVAVCVSGNICGSVCVYVAVGGRGGAVCGWWGGGGGSVCGWCVSVCICSGGGDGVCGNICVAIYMTHCTTGCFTGLSPPPSPWTFSIHEDYNL